MAAECNLRRYRPGMPVDLRYLQSASDDRLRTIVRSWFRTDNLDAILTEGPLFVA